MSVVASDGWMCRSAYDGDIVVALAEAQMRTFVDGGYRWPDGVARPATFEELFAAPAVQENGTGSVIDVGLIVDPDDDDEFGTVRPLTEVELRAIFDTDQPTRADFARVVEADGLPEYLPPWSANCVALYEDGLPVEMVFWGRAGH